MTRREHMKDVILATELSVKNSFELSDSDEDWPHINSSSHPLLYIRYKLIELDNRLKKLESERGRKVDI